MGVREMTVPDGITPVTAYRAWHVGEPGISDALLFAITTALRHSHVEAADDLRLRSLRDSRPWSRGVMSAKCDVARTLNENVLRWCEELDDSGEQAAQLGAMLHATVGRWRIELPPHRPPEPKCRCGLYALVDARAALQELSWGNRTVIGRVALWGRICEGYQADRVKGYRAEHARVTGILNPIEPDPPIVGLASSQRAAAVAANYQVPLLEPEEVGLGGWAKDVAKARKKVAAEAARRALAPAPWLSWSTRGW